ncbi:MAG: SPFH domain-containing protein [Paraclostridium sp.]
MKIKLNKIIIGLGALLVTCVGVTAITLTRVPVGYVGMVYSANGLEKDYLNQGWHMVAPWKTVTNYNISLEQAFLSSDKREGSKDNESFDIPSKDGKMINVDFEFSYRFDEDKISEIYKTHRGKNPEVIKDTFMRAKIKTWASEVSSNFTVIELYGDSRMELNKKAFEHIQNNFQPYGIVIESANFSRIGVDSQTEQAIQRTINARQELAKTQLDIEKQKIDTEIAQQRAIKEKVDIDLRNYELVSKAKAEAEANELRNKTITSEMIELEKIRRWNGVLPTVQGGNTPIIDIGNVK